MDFRRRIPELICSSESDWRGRLQVWLDPTPAEGETGTDMKVTFLHTADWQLGKPFAGVEDPQKRALLQHQRLEAVVRLGRLARERGAAFVLVAGDLFDSPSATKATVSAACSAIGAIGLPVYAIPGNHDHGGTGSLWEQDFFRRERDQLAPNFRILLKPEPVEVPGAVLLPCPLLRRHEAGDPTAWVRTAGGAFALPEDRPRIVLAHGSVVNFESFSDDEETDSGSANQIDLERLPQAEVDYVALGDWHGAKQVGAKAWYPGTPELDRFVKGGEHNPGNALVVGVERGQLPAVDVASTGAVGWHEKTFQFADDSSLVALEQTVLACVGSRANQDLLRLHLEGSLGIAARQRLEQLTESWGARLIRLQLLDRTTLAPTPEELDGLTRRAGDPLISRVAARLVALAAGADEPAAVARIALRELHAACQSR